MIRHVARYWAGFLQQMIVPVVVVGAVIALNLILPWWVAAGIILFVAVTGMGVRDYRRKQARTERT